MTTRDDTLQDPKLLRLLDLLHRIRSVTQGAKLLGQSQPTVSIWLSKLRRRLGDPLFVRTPGGMMPTPRAQALIGPVREALDALQRLATRDAPFDPASAERSFRICMTDASHITLLPPLLAHVRVLAPRAKLVAARIDERTAAALQSGAADQRSATRRGSRPASTSRRCKRRTGCAWPMRAIRTPAER